MNISVRELAELVEANFPVEAGDRRITGFASLRDAQDGDLSFFNTHRYRSQLATTRATAVLINRDVALPDAVVALVVADPSRAFEVVVDKFGFHACPARIGIHRSATVEAGLVANRTSICIGANAVIEEGVQIGDGSEIGAGCFIGRNVRIGRDTKIYPNVTVHEGCVLGDKVILHSGVVVGGDGFGYEFAQGRHRKIRQAGIVQIDDDVEIGSGTTVDRARFGRTWIGEGTKIDNLVQIAHNVTIGKHCIIVAGTGVAGSAHVGDYVVLAAQSGVGGHVSIGSGCTLGARSGVTKDLPAGTAAYMGFPAVPAGLERRRIAAGRMLPELFERVRVLEEKVSHIPG